jgi:hypothetical protein
MGDSCGGLVDLGPMDDVTNLTFETSVSPWPPGGSGGRVARGGLAMVASGGAPRADPGFDLVV